MVVILLALACSPLNLLLVSSRLLMLSSLVMTLVIVLVMVVAMLLISPRLGTALVTTSAR